MIAKAIPAALMTHLPNAWAMAAPVAPRKVRPQKVIAQTRYVRYVVCAAMLVFL